jgi:hypothetical protein
MAVVWATGAKANRVWIYVLTFCFCFFLAITAAAVIFAALDGGWRMSIRATLFFLFMDVSCYRALQSRRHAGNAHKNTAESNVKIV